MQQRLAKLTSFLKGGVVARLLRDGLRQKVCPDAHVLWRRGWNFCPAHHIKGSRIACLLVPGPAQAICTSLVSPCSASGAFVPFLWLCCRRCIIERLFVDAHNVRALFSKPDRTPPPPLVVPPPLSFPKGGWGTVFPGVGNDKGRGGGGYKIKRKAYVVQVWRSWCAQWRMRCAWCGEGKH